MLQACKGHCTFDSGLCSFENTEDENSDDFDWKVVSNMNKFTRCKQREIYSALKSYKRILRFSMYVQLGQNF